MSFERNIAHLSSMDSRKLQGKRVLLRVDVNLPLRADGVIDMQADWRLQAIVPTIQQLRQQNVSIVLAGHLGRPGGLVNESLSLAPIARRLSDLLRSEVVLAPGVLGPDVDAVIQSSAEYAVIMLENLRFDPGEESNNRTFAERLSSLGDFYMNDAFAASHREHASIVGVPILKPSVAGLLMEKEMKVFDAVLGASKHPFVLVLGGAKIKTKAPVIRRFLDKADAIVLVGALANSVLAARGVSVGMSVVEDVSAEIVESDKVIVPKDVVVAPSFDSSEGTIVSVDEIPEDQIAVDVGTETIAAARTIMEGAAMVVWNGPTGFIENDAFSGGTRLLAEAISTTSAMSIVGGGDTVGYLQRIQLLDSFSHVSTGGGAMLEYLGRGTLPGIEALLRSPL